MTILAVVFLFSLIILIHEFGHYAAAKRAGVFVVSFNLGFGPVLFSWQHDKTLFALRAIPFGGAVQLAGLDESADIKVPKKQRYDVKTLGQRFKILFAGSAMNILLGFFLFALVYSIVGIPEGVSPKIRTVVPKSMADIYGLKSGDRLLQVNNIDAQQNLTAAIKEIHQTVSGNSVTVVVQRASDNIVLSMPVQYNPAIKSSVIGIVLEPATLQKGNVPKAIWYGLLETLGFLIMFLQGLGSLFGKAFLQNVSGPVGIVTLSAEVVQHGWAAYLRFMAMLSLNIGLFNLLPLPALDGGRIMFVAFEAITRRKPSVKLEQTIHLMGFALLLGLILVVTYGDIIKLGGR